MELVRKQVLSKVRNQYKRGVFFDFTPTMLELLSGVLKDIAKDAKKATEQFNKLGEQDITDTINDAVKDSTNTIKKNILDIDNELKQRVKIIVQKHGDKENLRELIMIDLNKEFNNKYTKGRITTIATTETTKVYGKVSKETIIKSGELPVWQHTGRGKTDRSAHRAANGQKMNEKRKAFYVGGEWVEHPGNGSPSNAVNCHCILVKG